MLAGVGEWKEKEEKEEEKKKMQAVERMQIKRKTSKIKQQAERKE